MYGITTTTMATFIHEDALCDNETKKKIYQRFNEINARFEGRRSGVSKHNTDSISMLRAKVSWKSVDTEFTSV